MSTRKRFLGQLAGAAAAVFGMDAATNILASLPAQAPALLYPEGMWLLDGGTLELGIIRDSVLCSRENYFLFAETFESAAAIWPDGRGLAEVTTRPLSAFSGS